MPKLKLVRSSQVVKRERNIVGIVHRCSQHGEDRTRNLTRRYSTVASAFMRMTHFMVINGYVGDVAEIAHHTLGNKHFFFMIDGCANDGSARGFYNEFLKAELDQHRKVLEMVGAKIRTDESEHQLSGLGFSSTQHDSVICRVNGSFSRIINIKF